MDNALTQRIQFFVGMNGEIGGLSPTGLPARNTPKVTYQDMQRDCSLYPEGSSYHMPNIVPLVSITSLLFI